LLTAKFGKSQPIYLRGHLRYADNNEAKVGDHVAIDVKYKGVVVANLDAGEFSERCPEAHWRHLGTGVVIDTDFGGLVHYQNGTDESIVLVRRAGAL